MNIFDEEKNSISENIEILKRINALKKSIQELIKGKEGK